MSPIRILGWVLLTVGVVLLLIGIQASGSLANGFTRLFAGRLTHGTLNFLLGGIVCLVAGALMLVFGVRAPKE